MIDEHCFEIFLTVPPGLEPVLLQEVKNLGFPNPKQSTGGVTFEGGWADVWRANLWVRGATRVLARIGSFRAFHLAQLDKRARKFPWGDVLRADVPVRVEVTTNKKSKIYHAGAASQRVERALTEMMGIQIAADAGVTVKLRIDDNNCVFSVDTSGEALHKRGYKAAVGKAPMRETLAALFLNSCGYTGDEPVLDPMCGSGTFMIEAAEMATGLAPGRGRSFAFEKLATYDATAWQEMKAALPPMTVPAHRFWGSDRNVGAIENATANAKAAGVFEHCVLQQIAISDRERPDGTPGLVIINPPYGARIGNKKLLFALYAAVGQVLKARFSGWRVGIVTSDAQLVRATQLPFLPTEASIDHGGLRVKLYKTDPLR